MSARMQTEWTAERIARLLHKAKRSPTGWKACCPAHEDATPSLFIADGDDGIALVCYAGCTYRDVSDALKSKGVELFPSRDRLEIPHSHFQLGEYHSYWDYHDPAGAIVMRVCRWEQPNNKKDIRPLVRTADGWKWQHHPALRPLFQLDRLVNDADLPAIVVEGEKTAVAAQKLFPSHIATTWAGGAAATGQADWVPLSGRDVILIPDCDTPGRKAMQWVRNQIEKTAKSVRVVDPIEFAAELPEGWDLADAFHEKRDVSQWLQPKPEPTKPDKGLRGIDFGDMRPCLDQSYAIKGVLAPNTLAAIIGASGSGKTFFAIDMACHVAAGMSWYGRRTNRGLVVYGALEGGAGAQNRFSAWRKTKLKEQQSLPLRAMIDSINLRDPVDVLRFVEFVRAAETDHGEKCALVFIDTLSRAIAGGNENGPEDMGALVAGADSLRENTGACVLLIHHLGKDETKGGRGHSLFHAALDTEIAINAADAARVAVANKQRDWQDGDRFGFKLETVILGMDGDGDIVTSLISEPCEAPDAAKAEPKGKQQRALLRALRALAKDGHQVWTIEDLREIGRKQLLMHKQSARDAADALTLSPHMVPTVGGYKLAD